MTSDGMKHPPRLTNEIVDALTWGKELRAATWYHVYSTSDGLRFSPDLDSAAVRLGSFATDRDGKVRKWEWVADSEEWIRFKRE